MATTSKGIWTPDPGEGYDLTVDLAAMADTIDTAIGEHSTLRLTRTTIADVASTEHAFQIGASSAVNLAASTARIQARDNGAPNTLQLNTSGGNVLIGNSDSTVNIPGTINTRTAFTTLWSGAFYMNDAQTVALSQSVSSQNTGIILVWSLYSGGTAQDNSWSYTYVPRWHVEGLPQGTGASRGIRCLLGNASLDPVSKYIYVNNTTITGHADNVTGNGTSRVLRRVLGY